MSLLLFSFKYKTKNLVHMVMFLFEIPPCDLSISVGHALQLTKIEPFYSKKRSFSPVKCFLPR
jgi:hypothetical protein